MKRGLFITLEGGDGAGKTTQLTNLKEYLLAKGEDVLFTREPGGTPISEKIRGIILDKKNIDLDPMTEAFLYAAARAQHVSQVIKPALEHGKIVICDRFVDSSIAYQGYGRELGDCVSIINSYAIGENVPDVTFFLNMDPAKGKNRIPIKKQDRLDRESLIFHEKVYAGYLELEKRFPNRIISIDGQDSVENISREIIGQIEKILKEYHDQK